MRLRNWLRQLRGSLTHSRSRRKALSRTKAVGERLEERVLLVIPVAAGSSESTHFNTPLMGNISASDGDADSLTASVVIDPVNGSVMLNADGSFNYYPNAGFVGSDAFDFQVFDGSDFSNVATVTISVTNTSPTASGGSGSTEFNAPLMGFLFGSDAEADSLTASVTSNPLHGSVMLSSDGSFLYTPDLDYAGTDAFGFQFSDSAADSNIATFNITVQAASDDQFAECGSIRTASAAGGSIAVRRHDVAE